MLTLIYSSDKADRNGYTQPIFCVNNDDVNFAIINFFKIRKKRAES